MKYKLTERIYSSKENGAEDLLSLRNFFKEFTSRKKGKKYTEGLNGGIIITPDNWAAKINEEDGKDYHAYTNMNLVRFLNGVEDCFDTEVEAGRYALPKEETRNIIKENIMIVLLSTQRECKIIMFCYKNDHTPFQIKTLKEILEIVEEINDEYTDNIRIGFFDKNGVIEEDDFSKEQREKIEKHLNQYLEERPKMLMKTKKGNKGANIYG